MADGRAPEIEVLDLGKAPYALALEVQRLQHARLLEARDAGTPRVGVIILVEHDPPVITVTRRPGASAHLLAPAQRLEEMGIELAATDRGGDITYHGPGQLVAYPVVDLNALGLNLHAYMRLLEQAAIDTCSALGVPCVRDPGATGVWTRGPEGEPRAKIAALGVRVRRWVTMHGLALNVTTNLDHFGLIVPCGLAGRDVTSLERELGRTCPSMRDVKRALIASLESLMSRPLSERA